MKERGGESEPSFLPSLFEFLPLLLTALFDLPEEKDTGREKERRGKGPQQQRAQKKRGGKRRYGKKLSYLLEVQDDLRPAPDRLARGVARDRERPASLGLPDVLLVVVVLGHDLI